MKHIKKIYILVLLGFTTILLAWSNNDYETYNYKSFNQLKEVHKKFNYSEHDWRLLDAACFYETNLQRIKYKRKPLQYISALEKSAMDHSRDMYQKGYFSHIGRTSGKKTINQRIASIGIKNGYRGENIAYFETTKKLTYQQIAKKIVSKWMHSYKYKRNILSKKYQFFGCGISHYLGEVGEQKFFYATAHFTSKNTDNGYYYNYPDISKKETKIDKSKDIRGTWDCGNFGIMKLDFKNNKFIGTYTYNKGVVEGYFNISGQFIGRWHQRENNKKGSFSFELSIDKKSKKPIQMKGEWNYLNELKWQKGWNCIKK